MRRSSILTIGKLTISLFLPGAYIYDVEITKETFEDTCRSAELNDLEDAKFEDVISHW